MSHAANLRNHQHSALLSAKRRKLSDSSTRALPNGLSASSHPQQTTRLTAHTNLDTKSLKQRRPDDSAAKISRGGGDGDTLMTESANGVIEISSAEEEDEDDVSDKSSVEEDQFTGLHTPQSLHATNGADAPPKVAVVEKQNSVQQEIETGDGVPLNDHNDSRQDLSFGELLRARDNEHIDVSAAEKDVALAQAAAGSTVNQAAAVQIPSANSLGTVLTQALRSNDASLLEACLQVSNLQSIRATIERLPSVHAATLLERLAERMHKRPGRSGSLMVWVQWTVVAHGGFLASQPAAMTQLRELYRVVKLRATALQPLLTLKGKLDMLDAQMQLRKHRAGGAGNSRQQEENVIYVEGEESEDDEELELPNGLSGNDKAPQKSSKSVDFPTFDDSEDDDPMPLTNGVSATASVMEDDNDLAGLDSDDDEDDLIDDEAESTDNDSDARMSDDEISFDDEDEDDEADGEEDESSSEAGPPRSGKRSKISGG